MTISFDIWTLGQQYINGEYHTFSAADIAEICRFCEVAWQREIVARDGRVGGIPAAPVFRWFQGTPEARGGGICLLDYIIVSGCSCEAVVPGRARER